MAAAARFLRHREFDVLAEVLEAVGLHLRFDFGNQGLGGDEAGALHVERSPGARVFVVRLIAVAIDEVRAQRRLQNGRENLFLKLIEVRVRAVVPKAAVARKVTRSKIGVRALMGPRVAEVDDQSCSTGLGA